MYEDLRNLGLGRMTPEQAAEQKMLAEFSRRHMSDPQAAWAWLDAQRNTARETTIVEMVREQARRP